MLTISNQSIAAKYSQVAKPSLLLKFVAWTEGQQEHRLLWLGIAIAGHGCVLAPISILIMMLLGFQLSLFMVVTIAMTMALIVNLAALPTKITIPIFFASVIADIAVIVTAVIIS